MPAPVTTLRWVSISQHLCTLYNSSSLAMASSVLHNLIQDDCRIMKLFLILFWFAINQITTVKYYSCTVPWIIQIILLLLVYGCSAVSFY